MTKEFWASKKHPPWHHPKTTKFRRLGCALWDIAVDKSRSEWMHFYFYKIIYHSRCTHHHSRARTVMMWRYIRFLNIHKYQKDLMVFIIHRCFLIISAVCEPSTTAEQRESRIYGGRIDIFRTMFSHLAITVPHASTAMRYHICTSLSRLFWPASFFPRAMKILRFFTSEKRLERSERMQDK